MDAYFPRAVLAASRCAILAIFFLVAYALPTLAQSHKVFSLNDISDLIKNGVTPNRVAQLVEERGVGFELDDRALRRLKQDGANENVLSAVKKMSGRYTEEQQQIQRQSEQARRKREQDAKRREEQRLQQAKITQRTPDTDEVKKPSSNLATLRSPEAAGRVVTLGNVMTTTSGGVSGEVVNNSKQTLREVRLQILYSWRWKNEHQPGKDDPGKAIYHVLDKEVPPGQTVRFKYEPSPPFASREDGQFDISVKIVGFAQVFPGSAQR